MDTAPVAPEVGVTSLATIASGADDVPGLHTFSVPKSPDGTTLGGVGEVSRTCTVA